MTTEKEAFNEGYAAHDEGGSETDNPFPSCTDLNFAWRDGFAQAEEQAQLEDEQAENDEADGGEEE